MKCYEAMFLFDNNAAHEWPAVEAEVQRLCGRIGAELQVCLKFDERKLAYEIDGRKRGTYVLTYFNAPPERITDLERDARLSDTILRAMVLRANPSEEEIAKLQEHPADKPLTPFSNDSRRPDRDRDDRGGRGDRGGRSDRGDRGERGGERRDYRDRDRGERGERGDRGGRDREHTDREGRDSDGESSDN